ncbi:MAG: ATPase, T2SS/T4P/T4SS family [Sumerlaeia bacterium]
MAKFLQCARYTFILGLLFAVSLSSIFADTIIMNNGSQAEGRIVEENQQRIVFESNGIRREIQRSDIREIIRSDARSSSPAFAQLTQAEKMLEEKNALQALDQFFEAIALDESVREAESELGRRIIQGLTDAGTAAVAARDGDTLLDLADYLDNSATRELINYYFPNTQASVKKSIDSYRAQGWLFTGSDMMVEGNIADAVVAFERSTTFIARDSPLFAPASFQLGVNYAALADSEAANQRLETAKTYYATALENYQKAIDTATADAAMVQKARAEVRNIRDVRLPNINKQIIPTPAPTPIARFTPTPTPTPLPTPTPEPPKPTGMFVSLLGEERGVTWQEKYDELMGDTSGNQLLMISLYVAGFVLLYWLIPFFVLRFRRNRLDIRADQWMKWVKLLGIFALLGYLGETVLNMKSREKKVRAKHPCPHCGSALDDPTTYKNMRFEFCPNCGGEVKPVHTLLAYMKFLSDSLSSDASRVNDGIESIQNFVRRDGMQRLISVIIVHASRCRASDIHVEPAKEGVLIRQRVDGVMMEMIRFPQQLGPAIVSAMKVNSNLDISEKRKPQDGSMQQDVDGHLLDLRVATSPSQVGETATLRLLDSRALQMSVKNLGLTKSARQLFEQTIEEPHGLVLVTGPTGSGKTTTLYIALQSLTRGDKNIISIEDPIEFRIGGINQIQVNTAAGLTFASGLRSMLRQDPDVIMVGEIRDQETAEIAVNAAQTGHLVFSTLHTIDAASSVTRLYDLKISPRQFADALSLVMAQRLIRLVCPNCKYETKFTESQRDNLNINHEEFDLITPVLGKGCDHCIGTGYYGRTGIFEMLYPNAAIRNFLQKGEFSTVELRELAISNGMRTLREEANILLRQQLTTVDEVIRVTK